MSRQTDKWNENQYRTESADDRCARRQVPPEGEKQTSDSAEPRDHPPDEQAATDSRRKVDSANRRNNQITKNEQNAGDANEACHDQAENGVEEKIPPAHAQTFLVSPITIERDEQERAAENEMEDADDDKKREAFPNFMRRYEQNIANQHVLDFLVAFRRAAEQQDRSSSSHDIRNSDDRFLRDLARTFSGYRKNGPSDQSESERDAESGPTLKVEMK